MSCKPWCTDHDAETGQCFTGYTTVALSLETPVNTLTTEGYRPRPDEARIALETAPDGATWVVLCTETEGFTMTLQEAGRIAMGLWSLAAKGQAAA